VTDKKLEAIEAQKKLTEPVGEFLRLIGYKSRSAPITKEFFMASAKVIRLLYIRCWMRGLWASKFQE